MKSTNINLKYHLSNQIFVYFIKISSVQGDLSEKGHEELLELIPKVEKQYAERLTHLIQLAALWNCSVDEVMGKLGIEPPQVIHN